MYNVGEGDPSYEGFEHQYLKIALKHRRIKRMDEMQNLHNGSPS